MLVLTPEIVEGMYEFLRQTKPFKGWFLPHADEIEFRITRHKDRYGHFDTLRQGKGKKKKQQWMIGVSAANIGHTETLLKTMAHEMVHLAQAVRKTETKGAEHNAEFRRMMASVSNHHGFDPKSW